MEPREKLIFKHDLPKTLRYPDEGNLFEDASILRNAVAYSTTQRAVMAGLILDQPLEELASEPLNLGLLVTEAFAAQMAATEDTLGWLLVLERWAPGDARRSLFPLLNSVEVDRGEEDRLLKKLETADVEIVRRWLHIPSDEELSGLMSEANRASVAQAIEGQLAGFKRIAELRRDQGRGRVRAYNKFKHMNLGVFALNEEGNPALILPSITKWDDAGIHMSRVTLTADPGTVRMLAGQALQIEAVLHSILRLILWTRFGEEMPIFPWLRRAYDLMAEGPASAT
jgi:hypothetical protein